MVQTRLEIDDYTARVLDVVKGKFGLKNRSEALQKLALDSGNEYVELAPNEMVLKELDEIYINHTKKHGKRSMKDTELRKMLGL